MPAAQRHRKHAESWVCREYRSKGMTLVNRMFAVLVVLMGLGLLLGGIYLVTLGGSLYYVLAGLAYLIAGILLWQRQARGVWLLVLIAVLTIPWALWESGT